MTDPTKAEAVDSRRGSVFTINRLFLVATLGVWAAVFMNGNDAPSATPIPPAPASIDGLTTAGCLDGTHDLTVASDRGIYLGDRALDARGNKDAFWIKNTQGAIIHGRTGDDDGTVAQIDGGFRYTENGDRYSVFYTNYDHSQRGTIAVRVLVECNKVPSIDPGIVVVS